MISAAIIAEQLRSCAKLEDLVRGKQIHSSIRQSYLRNDRFLANLLIDMYGKCGCLDSAVSVFQAISNPNVFSWNIIIAACSHNSNLELGTIYFMKMSQRDALSWTTLVSAYAHRGQLLIAQKIFSAMPMWDAVSWNSLMWGLAEDGQIEEAWKMIHAMPVPDIVSWTVIIQALADAGDVPRAREIFDAMIQRNGVAWQLLVSGYAQLGHTDDAKFLFGRMPQHSLVSWNSMLACYSQAGNLEESKKTFDGMRIKDVASWTSIMTAYARCGHLADAERIFTEMPRKDVVAWNALAVAYNDMEMFERCEECYKKMPHWNLVSLNGYLHMTCIENAKQAKEFFDSMPRKNSISWNNILTASLRHHKLTDTKAVFDRSPKHTPVALSTMLQALVLEGDHSSFDQAELLYREIPNKEQDLFASSLMIAGYAQRGELDKSRRVFDSMEAWDFVSWTAIIQAHAHNAQIDPALELLRLMCLDGSSSPNEVTLLAILNGFAHCGLAEECCAFFLSIEPDFGIHPTLDHYCCVADLLSRARRLDEAEELVATMPFLPDAIAWATLLGACRIHGDAARGARIYGRVMDLDPTHAPSLLLASRIAADE